MQVLILDIGSSSVRAMIFDERGTLLHSARRTYSFDVIPPGAATMEAEVLRLNVEAAIDEVLPFAGEIAAVGMDTFVGNILGVDARGRAITPIYTYADTRSADDVLDLRQRIDVRVMHQRTGTVQHTAYLPARLQWLRRTEPVLFAQVAQWIDAGSYLYRCWFPNTVVPMSYSVASWSGLLNRETLTWDAKWLETLSLTETVLPMLADYNMPLSGTARWPQLAHVPFFLAVGDGAAANIGTGCTDPAKIALTLGTTAALRIVTEVDRAHVPFGLWHYRVNRAQHLIGGATSEGGNIFQWARSTLNLTEADIQAVGERPPDTHGLTFLPLLAGERSPGWAAHATGAVVGLRLSTTPLDLLQAALEGVALRLATIADQLDAPDAAVIGSGGALSPTWAQMIANALNRTVSVLESESAITAWGTAVLAFAALGVDAHAASPALGAVYTPQPENARIMAAALARQQDLYARLYAPV